MNWLRTLKTNWRDLLAFVFLGIGLAMIGGFADYIAARFGDSTFIRLVVPPLSNYMQGFSKFIGACLSSGTLWMILWPTVNRFGNHQFQLGWNSLTPAQKFFTYVGLICVALIAAAICFS